MFSHKNEFVKPETVPKPYPLKDVIDVNTWCLKYKIYSSFLGPKREIWSLMATKKTFYFIFS